LIINFWRFLWGWDYEKRKIYWVVWDKVCFPIAMGWLGVRDIHFFNYSLVARWKWRLGSKNGSGWRDLIESKYVDWRELGKSMTYIKSLNLWKDLGTICEENRESNWFDHRIRWKIGNGSRIKF